MATDEHIKTMSDEELFDTHEKLIHFTLRKYFLNRLYKINHVNGLTYEDLFQIGCLALYNARNRFDPSFGKFSTYAVPMIWGAVQRELRDNRQVKVPRSIVNLASKIYNEGLSDLPTNEIAKRLQVPENLVKVSLDYKDIPISIHQPAFHSSDGEDITLEDMVPDLSYSSMEDDSIDSMIVKEFLSTLSEREREVWDSYNKSDLNQSDIGDVLGVSQVHISRLLKRIELKASEFGRKLGFQTA